MDIWTLPGPSAFVDDIECAVREGSSVILRFPLEVPSGLERELRTRLQSVLEWTSVDAPSAGLDPLELLRQQLCPSASVSEVGGVNSFADSAWFQGRLFWMENMERGAWSNWYRVLRAYSDACRNVDLVSRSVFVVVLSGESNVADEIPQEVALVSHDFRCTVDVLDLFVFGLWKAPKNIMHGEHRALLIHTVAQIAQWDCVLAERLIALPLEEALSPSGALQEYAQERGWTADTSRCWEKGTVDGPKERPNVHSALLEVSGAHRAVGQRIWAAQAAVLLPLVEERRVGVVERYSRHLGLPIRTEDGRRIDDPMDLDVGQLAWHLDRLGKPQVLRRYVRRLRHVRNKLAHMEPLKPADALDGMLFRGP